MISISRNTGANDEARGEERGAAGNDATEDAAGDAAGGAAPDVGRTTLVLGAITLLSRVTGVVRDAALALTLGASFANDLFQLAFELPNFARRVVGDSSVAPLIVPLHDRVARRDGARGVAALTWQGTRLFAAASLVTALVVLTLSPLLPRLLLPAWSALPAGAPGDAARRLAVGMVALTAPYLALLLPITLLSALLQARHRFYLPAFGGLPLNLLLIAVAAGWAWSAGPILAGGGAEGAARGVMQGGPALGGGTVWLLLVLGATVVVGGGGRLALLLAGIGRAAWTPARDPDLSPELKRVFLRAGPALFVLAVPQLYVSLHLLLATLLGPSICKAGELDGLLSRLRYAHRIMEFPLAIVAGSLATTLVPSLFAVGVRGGGGPSGEELRSRLATAVRRLVRLALPSAAGLVLLAAPIVAILFQRGAWRAEDSAAAGGFLAAYALALPALGFGLLLTPASFALAGARRAARDGVIALAVAAVVSLVAVAASGRLETLPLGIVVAESWRARRSWLHLLASRPSSAAAAPVERRPRSLWTTTIASIGATVAMSAFVFLAAPIALPGEVVASADPLSLGPRLAAIIVAAAAIYFALLALAERFSPLPGRG